MVEDKSYSELIGDSVAVYRNLNTGNYSIRSRETKTRGLVIGHEEEVCLTNATFHVNQNRRKDVLEEERKNVHAVVKGTIVASETLHEKMPTDPSEIT